MAKSNGGVQLLHLNELVFDMTQGQDGVVVDGIYEKIEGTNKRFVVSGFSIKFGDDLTREYKDLVMTFVQNGDRFVASAWAGLGDTVDILVDDEDKVYVYANHFNVGDTLPERPDEPEEDTDWKLVLSYTVDAEGDPWSFHWEKLVEED